MKLNTVSDLKKRLEYMADDEFDNDEVLRLFNACQEDIAEIAGYAKVSVAKIQMGQPRVSLPIDIVSLAELRIKLDGWPTSKHIYFRSLVSPNDFYEGRINNNSERFSYERFGDVIELFPATQKNGELLIRYYARLPILTSMSSMPKLNPQFHDLYPLYGAMRYHQNYKDSLNEKRDFQAEYEALKSMLAQVTARKKRSNKSRSVYVVRRWV